MSDLLNSASLVMIPSGYKEDVVYSQIPTDGSGDMAFTRASNGTRINSAGLVEVCPWNMLQQSETFDNAYWNLYQATITSNTTTAPNGTTTADTLNSGSGFSGVVYTSAIFSAGDILTLSIYAKANTSSILQLGTTDGTDRSANFNLSTGVVVSSVGVTASIESVGNGWYRCSVSRTMLNPANFFVVEGTGSLSLFIWGAQTNVGVSAKPYFPTTDRLNVPRLTYQNGGGGCPSLLLEKQSTNLVVQSNDMTQWVNGAGTMTKNATTSPDGTNNALSFDNSGDCSTFASASNGVYSWSLFVKQGTSATASIDMSDGTTGDVITTFTFSTKTFSGTSAGGSWTSPSTSYIDLGNGWYRITLIATKNAGSSIGHKIIASGSGYTYVYGAQLEASSYPTSYIPTTSASATRVADVCSKTGISSLIGQTQGTIFYQIQRNNTDNDARLQISDGTTNNWLFVSIESGLVPRLYCNVGGVNQFSVYGSSVDNGFHKVALAYKNNDFKVYIDGVASITQTSGSVPTCSQLSVANTSPSNDIQSPSKIGQVILFPTRLTNAELASLTTL